MSWDDLFGDDDFLVVDENDLAVQSTEGDAWDTGCDPDIFASGQNQDIFSTH